MKKMTPDEVAEANRRMIANATRRKKPAAKPITMAPQPSESPKRRGHPPKKDNGDE